MTSGLRNSLGTYVQQTIFPLLGTATSVHYHARKQAVYNVVLVVEVEHGYGRHLPGRTAGPGRAGWFRKSHDVCMRIFLKKHIRTFSRTVIGLVFFGCDDPVPTEFLEVHRERVTTTPRLLR